MASAEVIEAVLRKRNQYLRSDESQTMTGRCAARQKKLVGDHLYDSTNQRQERQDPGRELATSILPRLLHQTPATP